MHTPKLMRGLTTLVVVALVGLLGAQLATAKPAPGPGPSSASVTANGVVSSFTCAMTFNPEPQYSGTNKVIHYGVRGDCDKPVDLMFQGWLYTVVGTGDNTRYVLEDSFAPRYATAQKLGHR
ncbi:hypothetical protein HDA40_006888 [Hamadaea flava]|uniref:Secreted protein n=1 Tax=Hamadaea flava TaxID=1742688 RepID=A0ABV8M2K4_9ACTN|nr:hypothetical protein [Hamadaea flava]MCP2328381.1 hypothetical protein [Hamadaea flava]